MSNEGVDALTVGSLDREWCSDAVFPEHPPVVNLWTWLPSLSLFDNVLMVLTFVVFFQRKGCVMAVVVES